MAPGDDVDRGTGLSVTGGERGWGDDVEGGARLCVNGGRGRESEVGGVAGGVLWGGRR